MGVGAGLYMCDVVKKFTFAITYPDELLSLSTYNFFRGSVRVSRVRDQDYG